MADQKPSFLRGVFAGAIHDSLLFPYPPTLDARDPGEARVVRRLIADLHEMVATGVIDSARFDAEEQISDEAMRAFAASGIMGITIPKEYGGLGLSNTGYARVFAAVAAIDASLGVVIGVHCGLGSKAIVLYGNDEQKARYLPLLARGEMLAAYGLTEPETGSDAQNIKTTAVLSEDGSHWVLNGRKIWIGLGHKAGVIATFAQTETVRDGQKRMKPTAFLIRPDMPGFVVEDTERKMGIRGSAQARLLYDDLRVPGRPRARHARQGLRGRGERAQRRPPLAGRRVHGRREGGARRDGEVLRGAGAVRPPARELRDHAAQDGRGGVAHLRERRDGGAARRRDGPQRGRGVARGRGGQGVRLGADLGDVRRHGADRRRARLREGRQQAVAAAPVRALPPRRAHQPDLRGRERRAPAVRGAQRDPGPRGAAQGLRQRAALAAAQPRLRHRLRPRSA
jgi:hypothetical protein